MESSLFISNLAQWYEANKRSLPWRKTKDPYAIWLSEIILQQTRVDQGLSYYQKFLDRFPDVRTLARAGENEVLSLWQGLGYYSRARNMHKAAQIIANSTSVFPDSYEEIKALPGVGPYTAAAIASFAFDLPHPVVDGNVIRFISRYFGMEAPVNSSPVIKEINKKVHQLFDRQDPALFNQAIMEFGAMHCKISSPLCSSCPFMEECQAFRTGKTNVIPIKIKSKKRRKRYFNYLVMESKDQIIIRKRTGKDIWENLYDFPLQEEGREKGLDISKVNEELVGYLKGKATASKRVKHVLSHQDIHARFWRYRLKELGPLLNEDWIIVNKNELKRYPVPKLIENYLFEF